MKLYKVCLTGTDVYLKAVIFNIENEKLKREITKEYLLDLIDSKQKDECDLKNPDNFEYGAKNIDGYRFIDRDFS